MAFEKVELEPGEERRITVSLRPADLAYFSDIHGQWVIEPGSYEILIGSSSADIRATLPLTLESGDIPQIAFTADHIIGDIASSALLPLFNPAHCPSRGGVALLSTVTCLVEFGMSMMSSSFETVIN